MNNRRWALAVMIGVACAVIQIEGGRPWQIWFGCVGLGVIVGLWAASALMARRHRRRMERPVNRPRLR